LGGAERDRKLLDQVVKGDETAFRDLYLHWQPQLTSFIYQITKSEELTAEIIQDVFLKIWLNREQLTKVENFKSYLFVVCRNQALNAFRKVMRELKYFKSLENALHLVVDTESVDPEESYLNLID
jgi:RNA polymerase sigma-70 factor (ECF subfamily)